MHPTTRAASSRYRIDVAVATKNNARTIDRCLKSIRANIPVRKLIVVDNGSTDETVSIAESNGATVVRETGLMGRVRYMLARACRTRWMIIVDSDVYIYPQWWARIKCYLTPDVGMASALCDPPSPQGLYYYYNFDIYNAYRHGLTTFSNTLLRRDLLSSCTALLNKVHLGEDGIFAAHIKKNGLRRVTVMENLCYHDKKYGPGLVIAHTRWGQSMRIMGSWVGFKMLARTLRSNLFDYINYSKTRRVKDPRVPVYMVYLWFHLAIGFIGIERGSA
jgi:glycosyltransferase involved in cell wall biosynthesis